MADITELMRGALEAFRPPEKLTLSEWADRHAFLSAESSAEAGQVAHAAVSERNDGRGD